MWFIADVGFSFQPIWLCNKYTRIFFVKKYHRKFHFTSIFFFAFWFCSVYSFYELDANCWTVTRSIRIGEVFRTSSTLVPLFSNVRRHKQNNRMFFFLHAVKRSSQIELCQRQPKIHRCLSNKNCWDNNKRWWMCVCVFVLFYDCGQIWIRRAAVNE